MKNQPFLRRLRWQSVSSALAWNSFEAATKTPEAQEAEVARLSAAFPLYGEVHRLREHHRGPDGSAISADRLDAMLSILGAIARVAEKRPRPRMKKSRSRHKANACNT